MPDRFYFDTGGPDDQAVLRGMRWLVDTARSGGDDRAALALPQVNNIENLGRSLGDVVARALRRDRVALIEGVRVEIATERRYTPVTGVVTLAVWPTARLLERIERSRPSALCVIPWMESDVDGWKANYAPREMSSGEPSPQPPEPTPTVVAALTSLTARVNLSTGISHPSDRDAAISMFRILMANGEPFSPAEVRVWAIAHNWTVSGASALEEVATKTLAGTRMRTRQARGGWIEDVFALWETQGTS